MQSVADWNGGRLISLAGRKKVLWAAGVMSRTGDASAQFRGFQRYLENGHGFSSGDFLELSYRARFSGGEWVPVSYQQADCDVPLERSSAQAAHALRWYDTRLPRDVELHLVGYSLGGVVLFRAVSELLTRERAHWPGRLRSLSTLSSPHFGTDLGIEGELLGLFGLGSILLPGDSVARELCTLGGDPRHRARVERDAQQLRGAGVRLLTLADEFDTVVTPDDAVIASPSEQSRFVLSSPRSRLGGRYADAVLGHGPLIDNPRAWALMAEVIGRQQPR
jgi:hypothetical protein